jgi:hypothetical protein
MEDSLARILKQPREIWMVKMADRISKLLPPPGAWTKERILEYCDEAVLIYEALRDADAILADRLQKKIESYRQYF